MQSRLFQSGSTERTHLPSSVEGLSSRLDPKPEVQLQPERELEPPRQRPQSLSTSEQEHERLQDWKQVIKSSRPHLFCFFSDAFDWVFCLNLRRTTPANYINPDCRSKLPATNCLHCEKNSFQCWKFKNHFIHKSKKSPLCIFSIVIYLLLVTCNVAD